MAWLFAHSAMRALQSPEALLPYAEQRSAGNLRLNMLVNTGGNGTSPGEVSRRRRPGISHMRRRRSRWPRAIFRGWTSSSDGAAGAASPVFCRCSVRTQVGNQPPGRSVRLSVRARWTTHVHFARPNSPSAPWLRSDLNTSNDADPPLSRMICFAFSQTRSFRASAKNW